MAWQPFWAFVGHSPAAHAIVPVACPVNEKVVLVGSENTQLCEDEQSAELGATFPYDAIVPDDGVTPDTLTESMTAVSESTAVVVGIRFRPCTLPQISWVPPSQPALHVWKNTCPVESP